MDGFLSQACAIVQSLYPIRLQRILFQPVRNIAESDNFLFSDQFKALRMKFD